MAFIKQRESALVMRNKGKSISEISEALQMSKSTISFWCRDVVLSQAQIRTLTEKQMRSGATGRLHAAEKKRRDRLGAIEVASKRGADDIGRVTARDIFMVGLALYWGEGYKSGNEEFGFTNSNPSIIHTYMMWLKSVYGIKNKDLILRVSINASHKARTREVEHYWSKLTNIPLRQFTTTSLIKTRSKKVYQNRDKHFGTLRIKVRRGTTLRRRVMGSLEEVAKQINR